MNDIACQFEGCKERALMYKVTYHQHITIEVKGQKGFQSKVFHRIGCSVHVGSFVIEAVREGGDCTVRRA